MAKFRKKPLVIEAEQFHMGGDPELWPEGIEWGGDLPEGTGCYVVRTLEGVMWVSDGDWIITGVKGEFYRCKDDVFRMTYQPADEATS